MLPSVLICAVTCIAMIASVLFFPKLKLGKLTLSTYWLITLLGAGILLACGQADLPALFGTLVADTAVNPLKILVLFLCMSILSVFLDELGFFGDLARAALKHAKSGQKKLFVVLYLTVSALTVFTSNDIIILSFTPFICYFAKNAKIDPTPYLAAEFVAANTWSLALIIGNPTNIYLATSYGLGFLDYLKYSLLPTLCAGIVSFAALYLLFRKKLSAPVAHEPMPAEPRDKLLLGGGIFHLAACTVLLAVGSYLNLEMWLISLFALLSLCAFNLVVCACRRRAPRELGQCLLHAPYALVPFALSMFVMIVVLAQHGVTGVIADALGEGAPVWKYGAVSFLASNLMNNIPMSVLFSSVLQSASEAVALPAMLATVIGSNLGALFTPIGALAGIMWSSMLNEHGIKFGYLSFLKIGVTVALPALAAALGGLSLSLLLC